MQSKVKREKEKDYIAVLILVHSNFGLRLILILKDEISLTQLVQKWINNH